MPVLRLPPRSLFDQRAQRLNALSEGHSLGGYLRFLAAIARAQHDALDLVHDVPLPDADTLRYCREHGLPPLSIHGWSRAPAWRTVLRRLVAVVAAEELPEAARTAAEYLGGVDDGKLEDLAAQMLSGDLAQVDRAAAAFLAAALQVYWLHMAATLPADLVAPPQVPHLCPVCASEPVVSIVRIGSAEHGLRYLCCSLCATEWHEVRIKCPYCQSTRGISYYGIEGSSGAVKAEDCESCGSYLKILYMEKDPAVEAVADDIASVALDVLMAGQGIARSGVNFFLLGGSA